MAAPIGAKLISEIAPPKGAVLVEDPLQEVNAPIEEVMDPRPAGVEQFIEPALTVATGALAEPVSGLAGTVQAFNPLAEPGAGAETVQNVQEAMTYQPRSQAGQENLAAMGEFLAPVGELLEGVETNLSDTVYDLTGSSVLAAGAATIPTAIMEALGFGLGRKIAKISTGLKGAPEKPPVLSEATKKEISAARVESAPDIETLKETSSKIYTELENSGVVLREKSFRSLVNQLNRKAAETNVDEVLTPKTRRIVEIMNRQAERGGPRSIAEVDNLRKQLQVAASAIDPTDQRAALILIDQLDDFLDTTSRSSFRSPPGVDATNINTRLQAARKLWGRARRAETINEIFQKAGIQASGFENGLRTQFRSLLNNKKQRKYFSADELAAMEELVKGKGMQNILKFVGKLGFSEGQATQLVGTAVGAGVGAAAFGAPGAIGVPILGQIAKRMAANLTEKAATMVDALVRGGADSEEIVKAYLRSVPKKERNPRKLAAMLIDPNIDLTALRQSSNKILQEAAELAAGRRAFEVSEAAGAAAPQIMQTEVQQQPQQVIQQ